MIKAIKTAYGNGYRAGRAEPFIQRPGGTRGITQIIPRVNPFDDVFQPERRNCILAFAWYSGNLDGQYSRLVRKRYKRGHAHG